MSTDVETPPQAPAPDPRRGERRPGELTARELLRWVWRQVTSMRTALLLLLLLALAAIPGSVIPQQDVDSLAVTRWKDKHPQLTPIYEKLDLFSVYSSPWFSAIYEVLLGASQGPRFGGFIALYGVDDTIALIESALAGELA